MTPGLLLIVGMALNCAQAAPVRFTVTGDSSGAEVMRVAPDAIVISTALVIASPLVSTGPFTLLNASMTISGAGGVGVLYGITAATVTAGAITATNNIFAVSGSSVGFGTITPEARYHFAGNYQNAILLDNGVVIRQKNTGGVAGNLLTRYFDNNVYLDSPDGPINFRVGITLAQKVSVLLAGDMSVATAGKGLILKAPNGTTCASITLSNLGALTTTSVTCP